MRLAEQALPYNRTIGYEKSTYLTIHRSQHTETRQ